MPKVKQSILVWARENSNLSLEDAARKLNLADSKAMSATEKLAALENEIKEPSRSVLLRMSRVYHQPLLTFYLDNPPIIGDRGEDFRSLPDYYLEDIGNAYVDVLIRDIKARQSTIRETLINEDEEIHLDFIGKYTIDHGVDRIAQTIRETIDFNINEYRSKSSHQKAFEVLRERIESVGIFVLLKRNLGSYHSDIDITVFRGFALADDIAPFIVINDQDAKTAWSFTLLHETAHLILGQTGISSTYTEKRIEKFCNNVASEILLPEDEFKTYRLSSLKFESLKDEITTYAFSKKLSSSHIAYRLFQRGDIDNQLWNKLNEYYRDRWLEQGRISKEKHSEKDGGPSYYVLQKYRLGSLVRLVQRLVYANALTTTKAAMLLDVKSLKLHRLFDMG